MLASLRTELGDAWSTRVIRPGDDLWVRVETVVVGRRRPCCARRARLQVLRFLSAWTGSRRRGAEARTIRPSLRPSAPTEIVQGVTGGTPASRCSPACTRRRRTSASRSRPTSPTTTCASSRGCRSTPAPTGTSARRGRCSASTFVGHPHLAHIYLPGDFEGYPLRKDFPLIARMVKPWPGIVDVEPHAGGGRRRRRSRGGERVTAVADRRAARRTSRRKPPTRA